MFMHTPIFFYGLEGHPYDCFQCGCNIQCIYIYMYILGLGDSVTIIIVSVTIMTAIAKTAIGIVDIWLQECIFDIFLS